MEKSLAEYLQSPNMVKIYVGPKRKMYYMHEELLCSLVPYFRAAFQHNGFSEGETKSIEMPEDEPEIFECLAMWVYSCSLLANSGGKNEPKEEKWEACQYHKCVFNYCDNLLMAFKTWVLLDKLGMVNLHDHLSHFWSQRKYPPNISDIPEEIVSYTYQYSVESWPLKQILIDIAAHAFYDIDRESTADVEKFMTKDKHFTKEVMKRVREHLFFKDRSIGHDGTACRSCRMHASSFW